MSHKPSRFRHANLVAVRREQCYFDLKPTSALWDLGNMVTANENVLALPILSLTGGRVAVLPLNKGCKVPSTVPSLMSHTAPVVDLTFNPFQRDVLVTGSEDTTIKLWKVPNEGLTEHLADPMATLTGHTKKVGILQFHPSAENVLLSAALDHKIKLWDISENKQHSELTVHKDMIQSVNFNLDGSLINTTCRDKKLRVLDVRSGDVVATVNGHQGSKATRSIWAKKMNVIITTGFDKDQHRQLMVWDVKNLKEPIHVQEVDRLTSVFMSMFDEDTGVLFLGGKGDTSISLWDINTSRTPIVLHATTMSCGTDPQRGLCLLPRVNLRPRDCELARLIRVTPNQTVPIAFSLPRKLAATQFQEDLYPPTFAPTPALSAKDFFGQKISKPPMLKSLRYLFDESSEEPPFAYTESNVCGSLSRQSSARPSTERGVVSNDKAKVELEAKRSSLKIKIEKATEKVQNARTELEKAEKELEELQRELKQLQ